MSYVRRSRNKFTGIANDKDEVLPCYAETELDVLKRAVIMNEIINSILEAEQKASEIVAKAGEESKLIAIKGEENAEKERENAVSAFSEERKKALAEAEQKAEAAYCKILSDGKARAQALKNACSDKIEGAAETAIGRIFG